MFYGLLGNQVQLYCGIYTSDINYTTMENGNAATIFDGAFGSYYDCNLHGFCINWDSAWDYNIPNSTNMVGYIMADAVTQYSQNADAYISLTTETLDLSDGISTGPYTGRCLPDHYQDVMTSSNTIDVNNITGNIYYVFCIELNLNDNSWSGTGHEDFVNLYEAFRTNPSYSSQTINLSSGTRTSSTYMNPRDISITFDGLYTNNGVGESTSLNICNGQNTSDVITVTDSSNNCSHTFKYIDNASYYVNGSPWHIRTLIAFKYLNSSKLVASSIGTPATVTLSHHDSGVSTTLLKYFLQDNLYSGHYLVYGFNYTCNSEQRQSYLYLYLDKYAYYNFPAGEVGGVISSETNCHCYENFVIQTAGQKYEFEQGFPKLILSSLSTTGSNPFHYVGASTKRYSGTNNNTITQSHFFVAETFNKYSHLDLQFFVRNKYNSYNINEYRKVDSSTLSNVNHTFLNSPQCPVIKDASGKIIACTSFCDSMRSIISSDLQNDNFASTLQTSSTITSIDNYVDISLDFNVKSNSTKLSYDSGIYSPACCHEQVTFVVAPEDLGGDVTSATKTYIYDFYLLYTNPTDASTGKKAVYSLNELYKNNLSGFDLTSAYSLVPKNNSMTDAEKKMAASSTTLNSYSKFTLGLNTNATAEFCSLDSNLNTEFVCGAAGTAALGPDSGSTISVINKQYAIGTYILADGQTSSSRVSLRTPIKYAGDQIDE